MNQQREHSDISLLIADDQVMLIDGLVMLFEKNDFRIVGKESNVNNVLDKYKETKPDVLICDVMFDMKLNSKTGLDVAEDILAYDSNANIVLYSQFENEENMKDAYSKGVKCFITKNIDTPELINAIETVADGQRYFPQKVAQRLASLSVQRPIEKSPKDLLNERLLKVFKLMAIGKTQVEIAKERDMHHRTIANDVKEIKDILKTNNQAEITMLAIKYDLINIDDALA